MKYNDTIDYGMLAGLEEKQEYLQAIQMLIADIRYNYEQNPDMQNLKPIYNSIAYLGNENGLMPETEKRILKMVKIRRNEFIQLYENS